MSNETVEISQSQLVALQNSSKLIDALWNDPVSGMTVKELTKKKFPNANIPELDAVQTVRKSETDILTKVEEANKATLSRIEAFEKSQKEKEDSDKEIKAKADFEAEVVSTKKKYQLSSEGMEKVFARMKEKNNPDVEAAAAWVTDHEVKAAPVQSSGYAPQSMNAFGSTQEDKDWELLQKNPWDMKFADKEITNILTDFNNGRGHLYGPNGMGGEL